MPVTPPEMNQLERTATLELRSRRRYRWKDSDRLRDKRRSFMRSFETFETGIYRTHRRWLTSGATARLSKMEPSDNAAEGHFTLVEFSADSYGQIMQNRLMVFKPVVV